MNEKFDQAIRRFDSENAQDPNLEVFNGRAVPRELLYAERLSAWVLQLDPAASEALRLAARCQHICRWRVPRGSFPSGKAGYHRWKTELKRFHAETAERILRDCGYSGPVIDQVRRFNLKEGTDPDSRTLEDALCLTFIEFQLPEFAARVDREKVVNALRKSWAKMTERARKAALSLPLAQAEKALVEEALAQETRGNP